MIIGVNTVSKACPYCFSEEIDHGEIITCNGGVIETIWWCNDCAQHKFEPLVDE